MKELYLAGGCFWCIASVYYSIEGVIDVISGFSGGNEINPRYEEVKNQQTSHRETIKIIYDENKVSFLKLLNIFYENIDPFDKDGQFIDRGHSYTLAIYYLNEDEKKIAEKFLLEKQKTFEKKIFISIEKFKSFYTAEEIHQHYSEKHPNEFNKELIESGRKK